MAGESRGSHTRLLYLPLKMHGNRVVDSGINARGREGVAATSSALENPHGVNRDRRGAYPVFAEGSSSVSETGKFFSPTRQAWARL